MQYATIAAWAADPRTGEAPAPGSPDEVSLKRRLAAASERVDDLLVTAIYRHDATGAPTDPALAAVLSAACIEQALYDEETDPDGQSIVYGAMSLGSLQLPSGGSSGSGGTPGPAPAAWGLLGAAARDGLLRFGPVG